MPTFRITSPDGKTYNVTAPEGATPDQVLSYVQQNAGAPKAEPPSKPFGEQMNEVVADVPRQLGLTARYGAEGVGNVLDTLATPIRAGLNAVLPNKQQSVGEKLAGLKPRPAIEGGSGAALADMLGLPQPRTAGERVIGDASRMVAGGMVPLAAGAQLSRLPGVAGGVGRVMASNPAQQLVSAGAAGAAGGYTRETGGNATSQLLASLTAGVAAPLGLGAASSMSQRAGDAARRLLNPQLPAQQIDITINNALSDTGLNLAQLPADVARSIRADVQQAMQISPNLSPDAVRRLADYRLTGLTPTQATLSLHPGDITHQKNLAKLGANSRDPAAQALAEVQNANNKALTGGLNNLGAAQAGDQVTAAQQIMGALEARNAQAKTGIDAAYAAARDTSGRAAALDPHAFTQRANDLLDDALLGGKLPADVRNLLNRTSAGEMPLTVDVAEQFKTRLGELQRSTADMAERKALGLVRSALDDAPLLPGQQMGQESIAAFNEARRLNRAWMQVVEKTPALQAIRDGVEPDKFVQQFITGGGAKSNITDLAQLKEVIGANPDALAAVKNQITAYLKNKATGGAADEVANFSQSSYNKALSGIGDQKLKLFFDPQEIAQLKALGRVASYEQVQPVGSAVNNSNTTGAMGGLLERLGGSSLLGKIPLGRAVVGDPLQNILISQQAGRALNAPRALTLPNVPRPQGLPMLGTGRTPAMSPAAILGLESEEQRKRRQQGLSLP